MAIYTRKEFAAAAGVTEQYLNAYISRGKVLLSKEGKIDTAIEANDEFLQPRLARRSGGSSVMKPKNSPAASSPEPKEPIYSDVPAPKQAQRHIAQQSLATQPGSEGDINWLSINQRTGLAKLLKTEKEVELKQIQIEKLKGALIETQTATDLVVGYTEHLKNRYLEASDNLITWLCEFAGVSGDVVAKAREKNIEMLNKAINDAADGFRKELSEAAKEVEETRGQGERRVA